MLLNAPKGNGAWPALALNPSATAHRYREGAARRGLITRPPAPDGSRGRAEAGWMQGACLDCPARPLGEPFGRRSYPGSTPSLRRSKPRFRGDSLTIDRARRVVLTRAWLCQSPAGVSPPPGAARPSSPPSVPSSGLESGAKFKKIAPREIAEKIGRDRVF
jgi:hypothetical protein